MLHASLGPGMMDQNVFRWTLNAGHSTDATVSAHRAMVDIRFPTVLVWSILTRNAGSLLETAHVLPVMKGTTTTLTRENVW